MNIDDFFDYYRQNEEGPIGGHIAWGNLEVLQHWLENPYTYVLLGCYDYYTNNPLFDKGQWIREVNGIHLNSVAPELSSGTYRQLYDALQIGNLESVRMSYLCRDAYETYAQGEYHSSQMKDAAYILKYHSYYRYVKETIEYFKSPIVNAKNNYCNNNEECKIVDNYISLCDRVIAPLVAKISPENLQNEEHQATLQKMEEYINNNKHN